MPRKRIVSKRRNYGNIEEPESRKDVTLSLEEGIQNSSTEIEPTKETSEYIPGIGYIDLKQLDVNNIKNALRAQGGGL
jgi:hypothetical protein